MVRWLVTACLISSVALAGVGGSLGTLQRADAASDTTKPTVLILEPKKGSSIPGGKVAISGKAGDNPGGSGLKLVEVRLDGGLYKVATPSPTGGYSSWSSSFNISSPGSHTIQAKATDVAGNKAWHSVTVSIISSPEPDIRYDPDTVIDSVKNGLGQSVANGGTTSNPQLNIYYHGVDNVGIAYFEGSLDAAAWSRITTASPLALTVNTEGQHSYRIRAIDDGGRLDHTPAQFTWTYNDAEPAPGPSNNKVALVMHANWLSNSEFDEMFSGNLDGNDMIRYRVAEYPDEYDQSRVDYLKDLRSSVPGLKLGLDIAYSDDIVQNAAKMKSQGFDFVEYNLEAGFDGPNSDSYAASNLVKIKAAADAVHAQGMEFRIAPGKPNSNSFLRTGLLDDVARLADYYHIQAQTLQDTSDDAYSDFTESIGKVVRTANPDCLVTSQVSPGQGSQSGMTLQQTMRSVVEEAMSRPAPGNTMGVGMWISGDDVAEAKSFYTWFHQNY